ncbi:SGNH hydrolase-type esterase domain-containing protein [Paraphoma chrysanthemicola]|uniref:SGNH hydrolase-type esterase domain-containing protein n=1 Tax=Paraphoma chrysanthemicola TaxID=798071 RepID=A0A8K0QXT8_9PLEO|nr:SGNH hydrolase-type esterase domain-containing protein [Paraphoma chrysanthemicola]
MLAVGDSYTAGIGANGDWDELGFTNCSRYEQSWPMQLRERNDWNDANDGHKPSLTFGACSGNLMKDLRERQLTQGEPIDTTKADFTPIGKPQIAVLTISGNDAGFAKIVNDCVFRYWKGDAPEPMLGCDQRLAMAEGIINDAQFKKDLLSTYSAVIKAGREAKGANPPEAFQAYVGGYIRLWNQDDEQCDKAVWNVLPFTYKQWLTRALRKRFNDLVIRLNQVVKEAADELRPYGVFLVEGYDEKFEGHRFCERYEHSCIHAYRYQDFNSENKIFSYQSRKYALSWYEGKDARDVCSHDMISTEPTIADDDQLLHEINEVLVPNEDERKRIDADHGPWDVSEGHWDKYHDIFEALIDRGQHDPVKAKNTKDYLYRMFHPKGSGYTHFADRWMEMIKANRDNPKAGSPPSPGSSPAPAPRPRTKALSILLEQIIWPVPPTEQRWIFFETKYGEPVGCRDIDNTSLKRKTPDDHNLGAINDLEKIYPGPAEHELRGLWGEDCVYKNDGSNAGRLFCPSAGDAGYECWEEPQKGKDGAFECDEMITRHAAITCEW